MSPAVSSGWAASIASASWSPPCHVAALMNAERKSGIALAQHLVAVTGVRFHLPFHHFVVNTTRPYQILVRAALDDGTILHQQNQIGAPDGGEAVPVSSRRPRVGSLKRATRSVTVVLPAPLRPTSATTDPPGTATLKSRTTGCPSRYSNVAPSKRNSRTNAGASLAPGRSGLSSCIASTSNTRSIAARDRCISENELTMFQTGLRSRNMYHWKAMMSPTVARPTRFK